MEDGTKRGGEIQDGVPGEQSGPHRIDGRRPDDPRAETLRSLFAETLGLHAVGFDDSFVDLGGRSLQAVRLINRIRSELGVELSMSTLFDSPTVNALIPRLDVGSEVAPLRRMGVSRVSHPVADRRGADSHG